MDVMTTAYKPGFGSGFTTGPEAAHVARCMNRADPVQESSNRSPDDGFEPQPGYTVYVDDKCVSEYKGRPIRDELTAKYAAFELMDPDGDAPSLISP